MQFRKGTDFLIGKEVTVSRGPGTRQGVGRQYGDVVNLRCAARYIRPVIG
jgi:hypothetical protein